MDRKKIDTVLFDIGGVLFPDTLQSMFYTPKVGLVDRLGLDWKEVFPKMVDAYLEFSHTRDAREEEYWESVSKRLGVTIPLKLVHEVGREVLKPNPQAADAFSMLKQRELRIGIISNNTDFWYRDAAKALNLESAVEPELVFLSHQYGVSKPAGLFERVLEHVEPKTTLFIDDRADNIYVASYLGFRATEYSMNEDTTDLITVLKAGLASRT